ncbi:MAG: flavin reductase family protein [Phycisphaerales bacterium]
MKEYSLSKAFQLIEPGPVVLLTTSDKGKNNVMTMSWHMDVEFTPQIACIVSEADYSFTALRKNKECVLAIPTIEMINTVVDIGNCSGQDVDKFTKFKLSILPAEKVKPPLLPQCLANIECRVIDSSLIKKYNMFILEGVKAWIDPKHKEKKTFHYNGDGTFRVDGQTLNLKRKMVKWKELIASF